MMTMHWAKKKCAKINSAENAIRDVVVLRCLSIAKPGDRDSFLDMAEKAFGASWCDKQRNHVLLAHSKVAEKFPGLTFLSNNQKATVLRGKPRPRRGERNKRSKSAPPAVGALTWPWMGEPRWVPCPSWAPLGEPRQEEQVRSDQAVVSLAPVSIPSVPALSIGALAFASSGG